MKKLIFIKLGLLFCLLVTSCDLIEEDSEEDLIQEDVDVETIVVVKQYFQTTDNYGSTEYIPETAYWNGTSIVFESFTPNNFLKEIEIKNINLSGEIFIEFDENSSIIGEFVTQENGFNRLYKTNITLTQWDDSFHDQGGYIHITSFNSNQNLADGEIEFTGWRWDNQLNREVSFGFNVQFENLTFIN